jgi:hypothetical protein
VKRKRRSLQTKSVQLGLILSGVLLALVILELGARLLPLPAARYKNYYSDGNLFVCSGTTGWAGRPDYQGLYAREEFSHSIQFNSVGMYDAEHSFEKADKTFRILWVGDSFAQALQVKEEQTAHQQLENLLNQRLGSPELSFEVISTAMVGWGTGQQLIYYREQGKLYQPDLVLLLFYLGNDVQDALPGEAFTIDNYNCFAPYFPMCGDGSPDLEPWYHVPGLDPAWNTCSPAYKWLTSGFSLVQRHSHLFAQIEPLFISLKERRLYGRGFGLPYAALYLPHESEEVRYGWQVAEGLLAQFNKEVKADGADFAVAMVGPREVVWLSQLNETQQQVFYQSAPIFVDAKIDYPNQRLAGFLQSQDIPVLDLQQPMIDYIAQTGAQIYLPIDRHWTAEGNRLAANLVFAWLVENDLLRNRDSE